MSLLSYLSVTIPLDQDYNVRAISPAGCRLSPEHILTNSDSPCEQLEHSVTIIPKLESDFRRKSVVDYAFPELHPEAELKIPSKNLLIYTQSGVDSSGRRHSVSIPLLPFSNAKSDTTILSIQRKGSVRKKKMESIQEKSGVDSSEAFPMETTKDNGAMDSLTVPEINGNKKRRRKMSPRQNSLPARKSERMSEAPKPPTGSDSSLRGSPRRSSKQEFYQFLDSAITH
eukprot:TRINITY_DN34481_c0_g1_i3.p1 TRINITY_DN34481_c0_g1~~TRINITY_DN34481_c0_g1_i3.p1  ORF type:complete len:235 (+),score=75.91 TRINITY_DN34481_c0_g1_i3:22-705(+)